MVVVVGGGAVETLLLLVPIFLVKLVGEGLKPLLPSPPGSAVPV